MLKNLPANISKNMLEVNKILTSEVSDDQKLNNVVSLIKTDNEETRTLIKMIYQSLTEQNKYLAAQNQELKNELESLTIEFEIVSKTLKSKIYEEQLAEDRRMKVKNRKRLPKRDPVTKETYQFLISESYSMRNYQGARLRIALVLLQVTGVRVSELLPLKISDIDKLFQQHWIAIDRKKKGPSNHKAFLSREGVELLKERAEDWQFLKYFKTLDSYVFTAENCEEAIGRQAITNLVNRFLATASKKLEDSPNLKSHSFRSGFITKLWRDTGDIEFVRQSIGHTKLDTTSEYIKSLTDKERQEKMKTLGNPK